MSLNGRIVSLFAVHLVHGNQWRTTELYCLFIAAEFVDGISFIRCIWKQVLPKSGSGRIWVPKSGHIWVSKCWPCPAVWRCVSEKIQVLIASSPCLSPSETCCTTCCTTASFTVEHLFHISYHLIKKYHCTYLVSITQCSYSQNLTSKHFCLIQDDHCHQWVKFKIQPQLDLVGNYCTNMSLVKLHNTINLWSTVIIHFH